jgi:conjugal transfer pilus assembly protein TraB
MIDRWHQYRDNFSAAVKARQKMLFIGGAVITSVLMVATMLLLSSNPAPVNAIATKPTSIQINSANRSINLQEVWVDRLEKERKFLNQRLEALEQTVKATAAVASAAAEDRLQKTTPSRDETELADQRSQTFSSKHLEEIHPTMAEPQGMSQQPATKPVIRKVTFQLTPGKVNKLGHTIDHYVPAGSFVSAILTSGVVAKTSIDAAGNPQPIHMEITDLGNLPRHFKTDIKACFVIGAAYGDIAAERAFVRLEKFSCVERGTGEVIEANVEGYVVGEDGANGLRGLIVDRSGPAVRNAFVGGFISGMGNFFAGSHNTPLNIMPGGVSSNPLQPKQMLKAGAGQGLSGAMEKYADFYIKRAEQAQPVIEIEAGRRVDIVFQRGFDLNQTLYRQSLIEKRGTDIKDSTKPATIGDNNE